MKATAKQLQTDRSETERLFKFLFQVNYGLEKFSYFELEYQSEINEVITSIDDLMNSILKARKR